MTDPEFQLGKQEGQPKSAFNMNDSISTNQGGGSCAYYRTMMSSSLVIMSCLQNL